MVLQHGMLEALWAPNTRSRRPVTAAEVDEMTGTGLQAHAHIVDQIADGDDVGVAATIRAHAEIRVTYLVGHQVVNATLLR